MKILSCFPGRAVFVILAMVFTHRSGASAQEDFTWWNLRHNWDGITHWKQYMILSPACMGPNALPVPDLRRSLIGEQMRFGVAADAYLSEGDHTSGLFARLLFPVVKNRVALEFYGVPVEYYVTDTVVRDRRRSREFDGRGFSAGDLYIGTMIQLSRDHRVWPDLVLGISLRVPSGSNVTGARFTDTPGYFFDLGAGRQVSPCIRLEAMAGFYSWQTTDPQHPQEDAFLYGIGTEVKLGILHWEQDLSGYAGYLRNGEDPLVYRTSLGKDLGQGQLRIEYLAGLHDYPFHRIRLHYYRHFQKK